MFLSLESPEAAKWATDNLQIESWQQNENIIGIDHHYINDIIDGMTASDLTMGEDFQVF